jgi:hypothetical protein
MQVLQNLKFTRKNFWDNWGPLLLIAVLVGLVQVSISKSPSIQSSANLTSQSQLIQDSKINPEVIKRLKKQDNYDPDMQSLILQVESIKASSLLTDQGFIEYNEAFLDLFRANRDQYKLLRKAMIEVSQLSIDPISTITDKIADVTNDPYTNSTIKDEKLQKLNFCRQVLENISNDTVLSKEQILQNSQAFLNDFLKRNNL